MPGYILHLTAAKILLNKIPKELSENNFLLGNLLPDVEKNKVVSHFQNPRNNSKILRYPDLDDFVKKYRNLLEESSVYGYYYHLYIDRKFYKEYLPKLVTYFDAYGNVTDEREYVEWVCIKATGEKISFEQFYSDQYYYGDFTKMNNYLIENYALPMDLKPDSINPVITEINYSDINKVIRELNSYLFMPVSAINDLNFFEINDLLSFLKLAANEWISKRDIC